MLNIPVPYYALPLLHNVKHHIQCIERRIIMKKEILPKEDQGKHQDGLPIQAILLLVVIGLSILAIVLKVANAL